MEFYSTNQVSPVVSLQEALYKGLPDDNGLYMPSVIPQLSHDFIAGCHELSFTDIAFEVSRALIGDEIPTDVLRSLIDDAFNFEVPLVQLDSNVHVLELFHGPTFAFKDFGARFMARLFGYFLEQSDNEINILVATSGDTGSAVAQGFLGVPGVSVTLLYPSGKVSDLQEKQLTTNGHNIAALEVTGTFDDCQKMVKEAFLDTNLNQKLNLTSANSINVARLIPQSFYYMYAWSRLKEVSEEIAFCVPSGNFGNLSGGLLARKMGMPVDHFVAATNVNDIVPHYLQTGNFEPKPSIQTLSNAMDVGNPSNFPRMQTLLGNDFKEIAGHIEGFAYDDEATLETISEVYDKFDYFLCPHSAIGYLGIKAFLDSHANFTGICLATAHPAKFMETVDRATGSDVDVPLALEEVMGKAKDSVVIGNQYEDLKSYLMK